MQLLLVVIALPGFLVSNFVQARSTALNASGTNLLENEVRAKKNSADESLKKDLSYFSSPLATALKKNVKKRKLEKIENPQLKAAALLMWNKKYDPNYRVATFQALLNPKTLGRQLMIGDGYSKYENITGIYLPKGKHLVLAEGINPDKPVNIIVPNWNRRAPEGVDPSKDPAGWGIKKKSFKLENGVNFIELTEFDGLAYVD